MTAVKFLVRTVDVLKFWILVVSQKGLDKQCRPESDCFLESVWSGSSLFAISAFNLRTEKNVVFFQNSYCIFYSYVTWSYFQTVSQNYSYVIWSYFLFHKNFGKLLSMFVFLWNKNYSLWNRPLSKSVYRKIHSLISQSNYMLWVLKRTVSMRRFFWAPKHMLKLMGKEIFTILRWNVLFILTYAGSNRADLSHRWPTKTIND